MQLFAQSNTHPGVVYVSILIQPEGRMQQLSG